MDGGHPADDRLSLTNELSRGEALEYLVLIKQAEPDLKGAEPDAWFDRLEREHDKLRAALRWFLDHGQSQEGLQVCALVWGFWTARGHIDEGRKWLAAFLEAPGAAEPTAVRAEALGGAARLAFRQADQKAVYAYHEEALAIWRRLNDRKGIARTLSGLAQAGLRDRDYRAVRSRCEESMALWRELGDKLGYGGPLHVLAELTRIEGDYERARALYDESLKLNRELGNRRMIATELQNLGSVELHEGKLRRATELFGESLRIGYDLRDTYLMPYPFVGLGGVAAVEGRPVRAARLLAVANALFEATGALIDPADEPLYERSLALARKGMDEAGFARARAEGRAMSLEQAFEHAVERTRED